MKRGPRVETQLNYSVVEGRKVYFIVAEKSSENPLFPTTELGQLTTLTHNSRPRVGEAPNFEQIMGNLDARRKGMSAHGGEGVCGEDRGQRKWRETCLSGVFQLGCVASFVLAADR